MERFPKILCSLYLLLALGTDAFGQKMIVREDLQEVFRHQSVDGTFVLYELEKDQIIIVNPDRARQRYFPASTFKIANSIIALETSVVADENEIIPYGDKPQPIKAWERDMSMREAIRISNVPIYQELARRIGYERYEKWLKQFNYGNGKVRDRKYRFWLDGPLAISAIEQVRFLMLVAQRSLPASLESQKKLADMILLESRKGAKLFGKTGWSIAARPQVGWFVGWVETKERISPFALNMEIRNRSDVAKRKAITIKLLQILADYGK